MGHKMCAILNRNGHELCGIDIDNREAGESFNADVIIDFSSSSCLKDNLDLAATKNVPIVIATTNHSSENLAMIESYSKLIPIFMASNFSLLFNVLLQLCSRLKPLKTCEFIVEETHHKHKKDSPSGSCKELLKVLKENNIEPQVSVYRVGEVIGRHAVKIYNGYESLEIMHDVSDREVFCEGALKACKFIIHKSKGLYTMNDLLKQPE